MAKKPTSPEVEMLPLNVDIPSDLLERIKLAKVITKTTIRQMVTEAIDAWLIKHGVTPEKVDKLKGR